MLLDGRGPDSWGLGQAIFSEDPVSTLEVFASGWGRWRRNGIPRWRYGAPLQQWDEFLALAAALAPQLPEPGAAGVLTVLSYDLKHWVERLPRRHAAPAQPVLFSAFYDWSCRTDYREQRTWLSAQTSSDLRSRLHHWDVRGAAGASAGENGRALRAQPMMTESAYRRMIDTALDYIAAGDIYQVNLAQPFHAPLRGADGPALFVRLCTSYPMPFSAYVHGGDWVLVSNSPECFLSVDGRAVATFPIKGTRGVGRPPGHTEPGGTQAANLDPSARVLLNDPKERAEHVMIVDLERNDLGRVCETGSVTVRELSALRSYPLLHHMVSRVEGRLTGAVSLGKLMAAMFPGGSITGAPKIRAMQIIEDLESCPRGFYTGAIGWTELNGRSRFSLAIRTAVISAQGLVYHAGGGIVADSDPRLEYEETLLKSEAFFRALAAL